MTPDASVDEATGSSASALELHAISKAFGGLIANDRVDLSVGRGEVHALVGENGAGKSTLMNIASGLLRPDSGTINVHGTRRIFNNPNDAIAARIGMVHQHFMLVPTLTVAENVVLGREVRKGLGVDRRAGERAVQDLAERTGLKVDEAALVRDVGVASQQRVEILKALHRRADVLLLDEPTAVLSPQETQELFVVLRQLAANGAAIVLITHKLDEALDLSERVTVLRHGRVVASLDTGSVDQTRLAGLMIGRPPEELSRRKDRPPERTVLTVEDLVVPDDRGNTAVRGVSLSVGEGEILGIAGVDGNGQAELVEAIAGMRAPSAGVISLDGRPLNALSTRERWELGVAHVPADRQRHGLILDFSLAENFMLRDYHRRPLSARGLLDRSRGTAICAEGIKTYDVRAPGTKALARSLSGGNQQKVILAREMATDPTLLLAAQPTRGLDVGSIEVVHRELLKKRDEGCSILLVSFEIDEILALADRVLVFYNGAVMLEGPVSRLTRDVIGLAMGGFVDA